VEGEEGRGARRGRYSLTSSVSGRIIEQYV
jgi:hypothetical protein